MIGNMSIKNWDISNKILRFPTNDKVPMMISMSQSMSGLVYVQSKTLKHLQKITSIVIRKVVDVNINITCYNNWFGA